MYPHHYFIRGPPQLKGLIYMVSAVSISPFAFYPYGPVAQPDRATDSYQEVAGSIPAGAFNAKHNIFPLTC